MPRWHERLERWTPEGRTVISPLLAIAERNPDVMKLQIVVGVAGPISVVPAIVFALRGIGKDVKPTLKGKRGRRDQRRTSFCCRRRRRKRVHGLG